MMLTSDAIREHVGALAFQRGNQYFVGGKVIHLEIDEDSIHGHVTGSQGDYYETDIELDEDGDILSSDCSCFVESACKHVAAVGMKAIVSVRTRKKPVTPLEEVQQKRQRKWMEPLSQLVTKDTREALPPFHLQVLVRFEESYVPSSWGSQSRFPQNRDIQRNVTFRPRLLDPQTGRYSSSKLTWAKAYSGNHPIYWDGAGILKEDHYVYLQLLAAGLGRGYSGQGWESISDIRAAYFWQILKQHREYGVTILGGQKGAVPVVISEELIDTRLVLEDSKDGIVVKKNILLGDTEIPEESVTFIGDPAVFCIRETDCYSFHPVVQGNQAAHRLAKSVHIPKEDIPILQQSLLPDLAKHMQVTTTTRAVTLPQKVDLTPFIGIKRLGQAAIGVSVGMSYADKTYPFVSLPDKTSIGGTVVLFNTTGVQKARDIFNRYVPAVDKAKQTVFEGIAAARFVAETIPALQQELSDLIIQKQDDLPVFTHDTSEAEVTYSVDGDDDATDWFDLQVTVTIGSEEVSFQELFAALAEGQEYILLTSGRYFSLNTPQFDRLKRLLHEAKSIQEKGAEGIRLTRFQAGLWEELQQTGVVARQAQRWQKTMEGLLSLRSVPMQSVPKTVNAELREYQIEGYSWMHFLREHELGGILADDMGLGKTVQAIAFMANQKNKTPFLVVAPTSVVENWDAELEKFAPKLKRVILRAGDRSEQFAAIADSDVVVVSYPLLVRDFPELKKYTFDTIIFDEAQMVKNYQSKAYMLSRKLKARTKIALTGTPMENNLMELWAICSLVAPGLFPTPEKFTEQYRTPIEKHQNQLVLTKLRSRIRPFLLRRQKSLVAKQLPPKNEQVLRLPLNAEHRHLYEKQLQYERKRVLGLLETGGLKEHRFEILRSLMRLRQMCLHPALLDEKHAEVPATKLEVLGESIEELVAEGHRVLIFSQFTSFLRLVKQMLDSRNYKYLYLAGETKKRGELIKRFNEETDIPIFLISLKAGGVGLNLTAADYCILLDPWWNPAVEQQAVDRTHRIGQTKPVFVYKMIAKDTIEEKVLALQEKKRKLFQNVLDEEGMFGSLITEDDIKNIFSE